MSQASQMIQSPTQTDYRPHDRVTDVDGDWFEAADDLLDGLGVVLAVHDIRSDQFNVLGDWTVNDQPDHADCSRRDPVVEIALVGELNALYGGHWHDWAAETIRSGGRSAPGDAVREPPTYFVPAGRLRLVESAADARPTESPGPAPRLTWRWD